MEHTGDGYTFDEALEKAVQEALPPHPDAGVQYDVTTIRGQYVGIEGRNHVKVTISTK